MTFRLTGAIAILAMVALPAFAQTPTPPSSQNSGVGIAGQPGGKNGPAPNSTATNDQKSPHGFAPSTEVGTQQPRRLNDQLLRQPLAPEKNGKQIRNSFFAEPAAGRPGDPMSIAICTGQTMRVCA